MGWGDELIASGHARRVYEETGKRSVIVDIYGRVRQNILWKNAPYILEQEHAGAEHITQCPGSRPYVLSKSGTHWQWKEYVPHPAHVFLTQDEYNWVEQSRLSDMVVIEWSIKPKASPNKLWPLHYWAELIELLTAMKLRPVTFGANQTHTRFHGVTRIETPTVRHAVALMQWARAYVGIEGFLHHAAAANHGVPAVVIMGGFIGPKQTGYNLPYHRYLTGDSEPCGARTPCVHCAEAMDRITPATVIAALKEVT